MPKISINYGNCCIYKIEHIKNDTFIYVGHTTNFKQRKAQHKNTCNNEKHSKFNLKLYTMIRLNGGWEMFVMIEVEKYPCNDKREAEKRENELMKELKASMNKNRSLITNEERLKKGKIYKEENKDKIKETVKEYKEKHKDNIKQYIKEYREENKEKLNQYSKEYNEENKEKLNQYSKEYREKNKEEVLKKKKEYREKNKDTIKQYNKEYYKNKKNKKE